jgi:glycosyltransferase involved in cell wall biosynthesis
VIIPTYNRAGMVRLAIESVLAQGYPDLEVLVVDDGSTDATPEVVQSFPVRYMRQPNRGTASARNRGIQVATGDLLAFLDSDDLYLAGRLRDQVAYFLQRPETVLVHSWFSIRDKSGRVCPGRRCRLSGSVGRELLAKSMQGPLATAAVMVRRDAAMMAGGFDEDFQLAEDTDLWCRLARTGPVGLVPKVVAEIRPHGGGPSTITRKQRLAATLRILDKGFAADPTLPVTLRWRLYVKAHLWSWLLALSTRLPARPSFWLRALWREPMAAAARVLPGRHQRRKP